MSVKQTESKITALYERLSRDDDNAGDRINYVKRKSNWKDADFQTWRLILKRVLSNSAESLDDFIRSEEGGEFEIF